MKNGARRARRWAAPAAAKMPAHVPVCRWQLTASYRGRCVPVCRSTHTPAQWFKTQQRFLKKASCSTRKKNRKFKKLNTPGTWNGGAPGATWKHGGGCGAAAHPVWRGSAREQEDRDDSQGGTETTSVHALVFWKSLLEESTRFAARALLFDPRFLPEKAVDSVPSEQDKCIELIHELDDKETQLSQLCYAVSCVVDAKDMVALNLAHKCDELAHELEPLKNASDDASSAVALGRQ
jgi:hypothetical protein